MLVKTNSLNDISKIVGEVWRQKNIKQARKETIGRDLHVQQSKNINVEK